MPGTTSHHLPARIRCLAPHPPRSRAWYRHEIAPPRDLLHRVRCPSGQVPGTTPNHHRVRCLAPARDLLHTQITCLAPPRHRHEICSTGSGAWHHTQPPSSNHHLPARVRCLAPPILAPPIQAPPIHHLSAKLRISAIDIAKMNRGLVLNTDGATPSPDPLFHPPKSNPHILRWFPCTCRLSDFP